ncbi:hypothetical protein GW17_00002918 [Ensete ventricosum]|nr:hypothetical protein GW17_00002918 [Ensete ventricosum]
MRNLRYDSEGERILWYIPTSTPQSTSVAMVEPVWRSRADVACRLNIVFVRDSHLSSTSSTCCSNVAQGCTKQHCPILNDSGSKGRCHSVYDRSSWRVGLLQCLHSLKGARQVRVQSRVVGRGEEATTSPVGLSYPKAKRRLERRWTRRSTIVPQRRIYRSRRKGCRCKSTDSRAMGLATPWYRRGGTSMESLILCSHGGRALVVKGAKEVENAKANSKYQDRAEAKKLHKIDVDGLLIKIAESEGLRVDAGVLDQGTK